jgi:hypothetical protein
MMTTTVGLTQSTQKAFDLHTQVVTECGIDRQPPTSPLIQDNNMEGRFSTEEILKRTSIRLHLLTSYTALPPYVPNSFSRKQKKKMSRIRVKRCKSEPRSRLGVKMYQHMEYLHYESDFG